MTACCSRCVWLVGLLGSTVAWQFDVKINGIKPRYCVPWPSHGYGSNVSNTAPRLESCDAKACGLQQVRTRRGITLPEASVDHAVACQRCECRACKQCLCADQLGRLMSDSICWRDRMYREDVVLGSFGTDTECRAACNNYVDVFQGDVDPATCGPPYEAPRACHVRLNQVLLPHPFNNRFLTALCDPSTSSLAQTLADEPAHVQLLLVWPTAVHWARGRRDVLAGVRSSARSALLIA